MTLFIDEIPSDLLALMIADWQVLFTTEFQLLIADDVIIARVPLLRACS